MPSIAKNPIITALIAFFALIFIISAGLIYYQFEKSREAQPEAARQSYEIADLENISGEAIPAPQITATDHIRGNIGAPVEMIIYGDFDCQFNAQYYGAIQQAREDYQDQIVIAFRHFPLSGHTMAMKAAIASECAAEQGKFWEMHDLLFEDKLANNLTIDELRQNAKTIGLDETVFNICLDSDKHKDEITAEMNQAKNYDITGTPGTLINKEPLAGAYPYEDFTGSDGRDRQGLKNIIAGYLR